MKSFKEYIVESREIGSMGISIELFEQFIDIIVMSNEGYSKLIQNNESAKKLYNQIYNILNKYVQNADIVIKSIYKYCDSTIFHLSKCGVDLDSNIIRFLYEKLCKSPANKVENIIGAGEEGAAIDLGDKILKSFYNGKIPKYKLQFYTACLNNNYDVFPKVYRIGKGYVIMEKLKTYTTKCKTYQKIIDKLYQKVYDGDYNIEDYSGIEREVVEWMEKIKILIPQVTRCNDMGDMIVDNFGERKDGTIVFFDI